MYLFIDSFILVQVQDYRVQLNNTIQIQTQIAHFKECLPVEGLASAEQENWIGGDGLQGHGHDPGHDFRPLGRVGHQDVSVNVSTECLKKH